MTKLLALPNVELIVGCQERTDDAPQSQSSRNTMKSHCGLSSHTDRPDIHRSHLEIQPPAKLQARFSSLSPREYVRLEFDLRVPSQMFRNAHGETCEDKLPFCPSPVDAVRMKHATPQQIQRVRQNVRPTAFETQSTVLGVTGRRGNCRNKNQ